MPFKYEIDERKKIAFVTASSDICLAESIQAMYDVAQDPRFNPSYGVLVDLRVSEYTPTLLESYQLARTLRELRHSYAGPMAVGVSNTVHLGIMRMIISFVEHDGMRMTASLDLDEARRWLEEQIQNLIQVFP